MTLTHPRLVREARTVSAMIRLYCAEVHGSGGTLCAECAQIDAYAAARLEKCPFQEGKTTCAKCPVHCYKVDMRERIRVVMRHAGPRMLYRHPVLAVMHLADGMRARPIKVRRRK